MKIHGLPGHFHLFTVFFSGSGGDMAMLFLPALLPFSGVTLAHQNVSDTTQIFDLPTWLCDI